MLESRFLHVSLFYLFRIPRTVLIPESLQPGRLAPALPGLRSVAQAAGPALLSAVAGVRVLRGRRAVGAHRLLVEALARMGGQDGQAADLSYFLSNPDNRRKVPYLLLVPARAGEAEVEGFAGAVLVFEYRSLLGGFGVYSTADTTGRRNVFARPELRARVAACAARALLERGGHVVHLALGYSSAESASGASMAGVLEGSRRRRGAWAWSSREIPLYLPLEASFDATLARIGQRTRSNLRYYRRRTERDLGCTFVECARLSLADFLLFNRECMFAVPEALARFRYGSLAQLEDAVFCGIQDREGRWLSLIGGRRRAAQEHPEPGSGLRQEVEIDWQMNRDGLAAYSLSTVMRAYLIEHEVKLRTERLYIEGGTPHPIGRSFVQESVAELTVRRRTVLTLALRWLSRRFVSKVYLAQVLRDTELRWQRW